MYHALAAIILIAFSLPAEAQMNPVGHWQTVDEKTQEPKSQVRIAESGTFDALMARKGYFYALYTVSQ